MKLSFEKILEKVLDMHVIDTHEHTYPWEVVSSRNPSIYDIFEGGYVFWIAKPPKNRGDYKGLVESVKEILGSTFYRTCAIAVKDIYGVNIDYPTEEAFIEASRAISEAYRDRYWIRRLFKEKSLIDKALWDPYWNIWGEPFDPEIFKPVLRINALLFGYSRDARDHNGNSPYIFEKYFGLEVSTFEDYMNLIDTVLEEAKRRGYVALKSALAYDRPLLFENVGEKDAKEVFNKRGKDLTPRDIKVFQDFILRYILSRAAKLDLPVQFHTGLAIIEGSNPINLANIIREYSNINFILFHGGYPWIRETAAMAMSFKNAYIDFCWLPMISPSACRLLLRETIELGLSGKAMWGGDCWAAEATYGALKIFKGILSETLWEMIDKGHLRSDDAIEIASKILYENAAKLFGLSR